MDRDEAAGAIAEALWSTERALDVAFAEMAGLLGVATRSRTDADWAIMVGQDAVNEIAAALPEMTVVRDRLIEAHRQFGRWQKRLGVQVRAGGGQDKPPDKSLQPAPVLEAVRPAA